MNEYSVKAVKAIRGHDGQGYSCTLTRNGKRVAEILDDGWGGGLQINWLDDNQKSVEFKFRDYTDEITTRKGSPEEALFNEHLMALPMIDGFDGKKMYTNCDIYIDELVNAVLLEKKIAGDLKKNVVAVIDGKVLNWKVKAPHTVETVIAHVNKIHPQALVLNLKTIPEVISTYKEHNLIA